MAISFVDATSAEATSLTMPTHDTGDILIMFALSSSASSPVAPAGWNTMFFGGGTNTANIAWKWAASSSETSGTWTNAVGLICASYRPASGSLLVARAEGTGGNGGTGTSITFSTSSLNEWDNSSAWSIACMSHATTANDLSSVGTGMTLREHLVGSAFEMNFADSNGVMERYTGGSVSVGATSAYFRSFCGQIAELTDPVTGGGGGAIGGGNLNGGFQ